MRDPRDDWRERAALRADALDAIAAAAQATVWGPRGRAGPAAGGTILTAPSVTQAAVCLERGFVKRWPK
jgi:hypothetical protein